MGIYVAYRDYEVRFINKALGALQCVVSIQRFLVPVKVSLKYTSPNRICNWLSRVNKISDTNFLLRHPLTNYL